MKVMIAALPFLLPLYLDPGSGSFILQLILAGALGLGVAVRVYWAKITALITGKKKDPAASEGESQDEE